MATDFTIEQDLSTGTTANFVDTSTGVTFSNILAVRLVIGNYLNQLNQQTLESPDEMEQWREYRSLTLTGYTYDDKLLGYGAKFIPFITGIAVQSGSEMQETGNYSEFIAPATYLPTANYTPYVLTPANSGVEDIDGRFPDGVYWATFEHYIQSTPNPIVTALANVQYIVAGSTGTATLGTDIFRIGEIVMVSTDTAVSYTGTATLRVLSGIKFKYFAFTYNIQKDLADIQLYLYQNCICDKELEAEICFIYDILAAVEFAVIQNLTSPSVISDMIIDMQNRINAINTRLSI